MRKARGDRRRLPATDVPGTTKAIGEASRSGRTTAGAARRSTSRSPWTTGAVISVIDRSTVRAIGIASISARGSSPATAPATRDSGAATTAGRVDAPAGAGTTATAANIDPAGTR